MLKIRNIMKIKLLGHKAEMERRAEEALRQCLGEVPFMKIKKITREPGQGIVRPDLLVETNEKVLVVEVKSSGQPRIAREAVNQLLRYQDSFRGAYPIFVAPYISPASARILEQEGIGYVDLSGNCRLQFGKIYIRKEGKDNQFAVKRDLRSLYSPRASRVVRALLENPGQKWRLLELAEEAGVSVGQVYNVKKLLLDREWVGFSKKGLTLVAPEPLLKEWSENYYLEKSPRFDFYSIRSPQETELDLAEFCFKNKVPFALTGFSAADRYAPFVNYLRAMAYVQGDLEKIAKRLKLKKVSSGANLSLFLPYDEAVFYHAKKIRGALTVSALQAYLDLIHFGERGKEAAEFLFQEVIKPGW